MRIVRYNPRYNRVNLFNEFDRMFENTFGASLFDANVNLGLPIDVVENEEGFVVKASVPGVNPDDVEITLEEDVLAIKGEIKAEDEVEEENYHIRERRYGAFGRNIRFPVAVNAEAVEATYDNGVLTLNVPKAEAVKPKKIVIKAS